MNNKVANTTQDYLRAKITPEARAFIDFWLADLNERLALFCMIVGGVYMVVGLPLLPTNCIPALLPYAVTWHISVLIFIGCLETYRRLSGKPIAKIVLCSQPLFSLASGGYAYQAFMLSTESSARWIATVSYLGVSALVMFAAPSNRHGFVYTCSVILFSFIGINLLSGVGIMNTLTLALVLALVFLAKVVSARIANRAGYSAYIIQDLARSAERQKHEHELSLARRIQSSMDLPRTQRLASGTVATFVQVVRDQVGGDWAALREFPDGTMVALVADAAGKGMQAALVVHAVQSLWTSTLEMTSLDCAEWLNQVNITLFHLGAKEPHAVTVGLLEMREGRKLRYWSAGHLPLIILQDDPRGQKRVHRLFGHGNMLGLERTAIIKPVTYELTGANTEIILATDGILPAPSRSRDLEVLKLIDDLSKRTDDKPLTDIEDDQTVIWLSRKNAA